MWPNGWMDKTPLGRPTEVDLGPGYIVLVEDTAVPRRGHSSRLLFSPWLLWPWSPISAIAELLLKYNFTVYLALPWHTTNMLLLSQKKLGSGNAFLSVNGLCVRWRRKKRVRHGRKRPRKREWNPLLPTRLLALIQMNQSIVCVSRYASFKTCFCSIDVV